MFEAFAPRSMPVPIESSLGLTMAYALAVAIDACVAEVRTEDSRLGMSHNHWMADLDSKPHMIGAMSFGEAEQPRRR